MNWNYDWPNIALRTLWYTKTLPLKVQSARPQVTVAWQYYRGKWCSLGDLGHGHLQKCWSNFTEWSLFPKWLFGSNEINTETAFLNQWWNLEIETSFLSWFEYRQLINVLTRRNYLHVCNFPSFYSTPLLAGSPLRAELLLKPKTPTPTKKTRTKGEVLITIFAQKWSLLELDETRTVPSRAFITRISCFRLFAEEDIWCGRQADNCSLASEIIRLHCKAENDNVQAKVQCSA